MGRDRSVGVCRCDRDPYGRERSAVLHSCACGFQRSRQVKDWIRNHWKGILAVGTGIAGAYVCPVLPAPYSAPCSMIANLVGGLIGQ